MQNKNTMSMAEYIIGTLNAWLISNCTYTMFLFCPVGENHTRSQMLYGFLTVAAALLGIVITWKRRRNGMSVFVNALCGPSIYFLLSFRRIIPGAVTAAVILIGILTALNTAVIVLARRLDPYVRRRISRKRVATACLLNARTICVMICFFIMFYIAGMTAMGIPFLSAEKEQPQEYSAESALNGRHSEEFRGEILLQLTEENWEQCTPKERLQILQSVAELEATALGIPNDMTVHGELMDENTLGYYSDSYRRIVINLSHLAEQTREEALFTLLHEVYHAYQHRLVDMWEMLPQEQQNLQIFDLTRVFVQEFDSYTDGSDNYLQYMSQLCELTSNAYAENTAERYLAEIDEYVMNNA